MAAVVFFHGIPPSMDINIEMNYRLSLSPAELRLLRLALIGKLTELKDLAQAQDLWKKINDQRIKQLDQARVYAGGDSTKAD